MNMQDISPDMRELLQLLLQHNVQFALCGGFAVSYHGFIRTTMDLDFADLWGMRIPVVSRRALLRAKQEAGRPKDRIDFEELTKVSTTATCDHENSPAGTCSVIHPTVPPHTPP